MAGMLLLAAGAGGLPFAEDIEDIIDTIGQWLGYRTNTRRTIRRGLSAVAGQRAADIAMNGVLSQVGVDLHSRLGLQNILPGSALLKPSTTDKSREFQDLLGPAASVVAAIIGGHAVYVDAGKLYHKIPTAQFPGQRLVCDL